MISIRFFVLHPSCNDVSSGLNYLGISSLDEKYNFIWSADKPDYCFVTELIYWNDKMRRLFLKKYIDSPILIFYTGEAVSPDFNIFDYGIGFDYDLKYNDRFVQLPPAESFFSNFIKQKESSIHSIEEARNELSHKTSFCNFLYSNYRAHPNRDKLFYILSQYKKVDSLGKHLNNMGNKATGYQGHYDDCTKIKSAYKFSIASENATFPGYYTEKILTSLEANTIPIYWGDPYISEFLNPKRFIDCTHLDRLEQVVDIVKEIDNNDDMWCQMVSEPWQTPEQLIKSKQRMNEYYDFFDNLFTSEPRVSKRAPSGTFPNTYRKLLLEGRIKDNTYLQRVGIYIKNKIKSK